MWTELRGRSAPSTGTDGRVVEGLPVWILVLLLGIVLSVGIVVLMLRPGVGKQQRTAGFTAALVILFVFFALSSIRFVGASQVGVVVKNVLGKKLPGAKIIATEGEMGIQAEVLSPGWHFWYWPGVYDLKTVALTEIASDEVGIIETADGLPLTDGELFAPEWSREEFQKMLDAEYFLTTGKGRKGKQVSVLTPGKYRLNPELFRVKMVKQTEVLAGEVAVLKANFGTPPTHVVPHISAGASDKPSSAEETLKLAKVGEMGVVAEPLPPGKYPLNTDAYTVTEIWTTQMIAHFSAVIGSDSKNSFNQIAQQTSQNKSARHDAGLEEREITVRTSDGFTFPVDVRLEYVVEPRDAPIVVAKLGDDEGERFRNAINSAVRAIFRNNGEKVRALDYVQQRSQQESQSLTMLKEQLLRFGVHVTAVRIGNVGDEASLGTLLKTQTERELAKQQEVTLQEKQKAAQRQKELSRTEQEAEEEKRLATASYAVKIAEEDKRKQIIAAGAEAESLTIRAEAQAQSYKLIASQIGPANSAMLEMLKIVGERQIQITPRVMINQHGTGTGSGSSSGMTSGAGEMTALAGTILDQMISKEEVPPAAIPPTVKKAPVTAPSGK